MTSLTVVPGESLRGAQAPRISYVPEYVDSSTGEEAIELAELAGLHLDPWQQIVLRHSLGERADGKWAAYEVGLCVGRQNGKGAILEARELAGLFILGEREIVHSAHEQLTATNHFRRLLALIRGVPELDRRVLKAPQGKGAEAIELVSGQRILFKTRTGDAGRGLTGDLVVLDEAMNIPEAAMAALVPTMAARSIEGNPQLWYAGSAVDQETDPHGIAFARIRERGVAGRGRIAYFEWSAEGESPGNVNERQRWDRDAWAQANPGLGIRIAEEHIENECNGALGPRKFCVERLGIGDWPDTSEDANRIISRADWADAAEHDPSNRITGVPVFAADADPNMTHAAIAVSGQRADGLFNGAVVACERGTDWIVERCLALKAEHPRMRVVIHKQGPLGSHIDDLKKAKIRVVEASTEDYSRACVGFIAGVSERRFKYPFPQPELDDAIAGARKREGEAVKWTRKDAETNIAPLVAVSFAFWGAERSKRSTVVDMEDLYRKIAEEDADAVNSP